MGNKILRPTEPLNEHAYGPHIGLGMVGILLVILAYIWYQRRGMGSSTPLPARSSTNIPSYPLLSGYRGWLSYQFHPEFGAYAGALKGEGN